MSLIRKSPIVLLDKPVSFDIVIMTDLRLTGGNSSSTAEELKAQSRLGYNTGVLHIPNPSTKIGLPFNKKIIECLKQENITLIDNYAHVETKLLIVRGPSILRNYKSFRGHLNVNEVRIIANNAVKDKNGTYYDVPEIDAVARKIGKTTWHPIGPLVRSTLAPFSDSISLSDKDWVNIIDEREWYSNRSKPVSTRPVVGRHGRDHYMKWPDNPKSILRVYPNDQKYTVRILGGAAIPRSILGAIPSNWMIHPYTSTGAPDFLSKIDFFVYYHHPGLIEAFGRTILEALASGAVAIVPRHFEPLFKDACIYADEQEVTEVIDTLYSDWKLYLKQSKRGRDFIIKHFSYQAHKLRLISLVGNPAKVVNKRKHAETLLNIKHIDYKLIITDISQKTDLVQLKKLCKIIQKQGYVPILLVFSAQYIDQLTSANIPTEYLPPRLLCYSPPEWGALLIHRLESLVALYQPSSIVTLNFSLDTELSLAEGNTPGRLAKMLLKDSSAPSPKGTITSIDIATGERTVLREVV